MTNWAALDVAIGIIAVFFVLSLLASTLNEAIATALDWRAKFLERWPETSSSRRTRARRSHPQKGRGRRQARKIDSCCRPARTTADWP
jgi:hypothetical protein